MVRFETCMATAALAALLVACGNGSHQPGPPAAVPAPVVAPQAIPPSAPDPKAKQDTAPKDSAGTGTYPWQSGPIASL